MTQVPVDHYIEILNKPTTDTDDVSNILTLSGGGTGATSFSMGAVGYLVKHGLFDQYDTINAVSGSTVLLTLLEPTYALGRMKEPDWYNKYIRNVMYSLMKQRLAAKMIVKYMNPINWFRNPADVLATVFAPLWDTLLKDYNTSFVGYTGRKFLYNYIDVDTWHISTDHSDLYNPETGERVPNWYIVRMWRCCLPFSYGNYRRSMDAGFIDNNALYTMLDLYKFEKSMTVTTEVDLYPSPIVRKEVSSFWALVQFIGSAIIDWSTIPANKLNIHLSTTILGILKRNGTDIRIAYPEWNPELYAHPLDLKAQIYNGLLFCDEPVARITENLGYVAMHRALGHRETVPVSELPNPEYPLDASVRPHIERFKMRSVWTYIALDVWEASWKPMLQSMMFWK